MLIFHNVPLTVAIGLAGAVLAYNAYRRWKSQSLDPRSELRKEQESLRAALQALPAQLDSAKRLRMAAAEGSGFLESQAVQQWLGEFDIDSLELKMLESQLPAADSDYSELSELELDIRLVEILTLSLRADCLADKYRIGASANDRNRETPIDQAGSLSHPPVVRHPPLSLEAPSIR
jgi:hypothetical protein